MTESTNLLALILKNASTWFHEEISLVGANENRMETARINTKKLCEALAEHIGEDGDPPDVIAALGQVVMVESIINIRR